MQPAEPRPDLDATVELLAATVESGKKNGLAIVWFGVEPLTRILTALRAAATTGATLRQMNAENDSLRAIAARIMPCHYCGVDEIAKCPHGFPGCALADDIQSEGLSLGAELRTAREEIEELNASLEDEEAGHSETLNLWKAAAKLASDNATEAGELAGALERAIEWMPLCSSRQSVCQCQRCQVIQTYARYRAAHPAHPAKEGTDATPMICIECGEKFLRCNGHNCRRGAHYVPAAPVAAADPAPDHERPPGGERT